MIDNIENFDTGSLQRMVLGKTFLLGTEKEVERCKS